MDKIDWLDVLEIAIELSDKYCDGVSNVKCLVSSGKIYEEITDVAESVGASLIVMGTDGTPKDIKKKFIGCLYKMRERRSCLKIEIRKVSGKVFGRFQNSKKSKREIE